MRGGTLRIAMLAVVWLAVTGTSLANEETYKIIVNPDNPITSIDREFLRDAYLKKATEWNHGETIRPVDLSTAHAVRERFTQEVIKKSPSQLKNYWNQQIFSGKGVPPPEADSPAAAIAYVLANPGGIGYVPVGADVGRAKVVPIR